MAQAKKSTVKAYVGSTTKKSRKKGISFTKRSALFGLVGVVAFSVVGGFGWQKWDEHNLKAKAYSYTKLPVSDTTFTGYGGYLKSCKQKMTRGDWRVFVYGQKPTLKTQYTDLLKYVSVISIDGAGNYKNGYSYPLNTNGYAYTFLYVPSSKGYRIAGSLTQYSNIFTYTGGALPSPGSSVTTQYVSVDTQIVEC